MILQESILSAFTEKGTLLKWLKKVESALKDSTLTDVNIVQSDETHAKIVFRFEGGQTIETPELVLPRGAEGAAGPQGPAGQNAEQSTIDILETVTGDPGTEANVRNNGTTEHAELIFTIPRGATGAPGVGFDNASEISINDGDISLSIADGLNINAKFKVAVDDEILEIPSEMYIPLHGSESIVIDVDETGQFFEVHLDGMYLNKIERALLTPLTAPASTQLVGVGTSKDQQMINIGEGLSLTGNTLSAPCGGGRGTVIDTSRIYNFSCSGGLYNDSILFNGMVSADPNFYPVYHDLSFIPSKCAAVIINGFGGLVVSNITGTLILADGTQITPSNITQHLGKLMILQSDVTIYGQFP